MKKRFLLFLSGMAFSTAAMAQSAILLRWQDFRNSGMPKSDQVGVVTSFLTLTQIDFNQEDTNAFWDLRGINYNSFHTIQRDSISGPAAGGPPEYQYGEPGQTQLGSIPYTETVRYLRDTSGIFGIGETLPYQAIGLGQTTGFATDTLYIPDQAPGYITPIIKFPTDFYNGPFGNKYWYSNYQYVTQYQLTVAAAQFNRESFTRNTSKDVNTAVIGWGKVLLNDPSRGGRTTDSIDVLQVRVEEVTTDIYLNSSGMPMNASILSALALDDTTVEKKGYILLVRRGETTPLLRIEYDGTPSTSTPQQAWVHLDRLPASQAVHSVAASAAAVKMYPNPVRVGEALSIDCATIGDWQLRLSSLTGQQVLDARWNRAQTGTEAVQMPPVAPGMYIYQLFQNGQPVQAGRLMLAE